MTAQVKLVNGAAMRRLEKLPAAMATRHRDAVQKAALIIKRSVESQPGFTRRLRNMGRSGAAIGIGFDVKGDRRPTALVKMRGPAHLIERDIKPHTIMPRRVGRAQGRSRQARSDARAELYGFLFGGAGFGAPAVKLPDGGLRHSVRHPGAKGRHPFEKGVKAAAPQALKVLGNATELALGQVLRG